MIFLQGGAQNLKLHCWFEMTLLLGMYVVLSRRYAVINFADEETATKNVEVLKAKNVHGVELQVDFVGAQSIVTFVTPALTASSDPLKLYVTGFGRDITLDQLKEMFPTCNDVTLPLNPKDGNKPIG